MESIVKILVGLGLMGLSLAYLYRPSFIMRINAWAKVFLFNDAYLLHHRRRWGLLAFLAGILFLYSGLLNTTPRAPSGPDPLESGYSAFYAGRLDDAAAIADQILQGEPGNRHAEFLLRVSRLLKLKTKSHR
jgi:hypothetical protein